MVPNSIAGIVFSVDWPEKNHWSVRQNVWPVWYANQSSFRFVKIRFQIIRFLFSEKYANFIHKQGATEYKHMDKILEKVTPSPNSPKITVAYGELPVYFAVHIPPFIDWIWTAEMTMSLQVDLLLSDAASTSEA